MNTYYPYTFKAGLFGIGFEAYWQQFDDLREFLTRYLSLVHERLATNKVEVINLGLIDTPQKAVQAGHHFSAADVDIIFMYVTTYALSATVLPVVQHAKESASDCAKPFSRWFD